MIAQVFQCIADGGRAEEPWAAKAGGPNACDLLDDFGVALQAVEDLLRQRRNHSGDVEKLVAHGLVVERVRADLMAGVPHHRHHLGVLLCRVPCEEEGRVHVVLLQDAKDVLRAGTEALVPGSPAPDVGLHVEAKDGRDAHDALRQMDEVVNEILLVYELMAKGDFEFSLKMAFRRNVTFL